MKQPGQNRFSNGAGGRRIGNWQLSPLRLLVVRIGSLP